jgi:hypothetical protein
MAREGCGPEEAFDVLRRTSQQANLKVHVLAAFLIEQVSGKAAGISPGSEPCGQDDKIMAALLGPGRSVACRPGHGSPGG